MPLLLAGLLAGCAVAVEDAPEDAPPDAVETHRGLPPTGGGSPGACSKQSRLELESGVVHVPIPCTPVIVDRGDPPPDLPARAGQPLDRLADPAETLGAGPGG